jgi:hypothetical protein
MSENSGNEAFHGIWHEQWCFEAGVTLNEPFNNAKQSSHGLSARPGFDDIRSGLALLVEMTGIKSQVGTKT